MKTRKLLCFALLALLMAGTVMAGTVYRQGDSGEQVKKIQTKLKNWGYYDGAPDGIYGSRTVSAVKYFQRSNGLTADGVCGPATLRALGMPATAGGGSAPVGGTSDELYLMARMISAEARGEPFVGQVAVGAVILNRVESPHFPNTIAEVLYQPGAFSALLDGQFDQPIADSAWRAAREALSGTDPSGGAVYYYNPVTSTSKWIFSRETITTIGKHIFAK
jgi:N-acetylmuramoyl-L-alanine amidase